MVSDRPKVLAEVHGRPFLAYLLDHLETAGIRTVVLCTGYLGEQVYQAFGDHRRGLHLIYSEEPSPLGTAGALRLALPWLDSDPVLVLNGDSFCQVDLKALFTGHSTWGADATLLLTQVTDTSRYGRVQVNEDGQITGFEEKGTVKEPGWINAGTYLLHKKLIEGIPADRFVSLERDMFPQWLCKKMYGYQGGRDFLDIGTEESYAAAEEHFAQRY